MLDKKRKECYTETAEEIKEKKQIRFTYSRTKEIKEENDMNDMQETVLENELNTGDYTAAREVCEKFSADEEKDTAEATSARLFAMLVA